MGKQVTGDDKVIDRSISLAISRTKSARSFSGILALGEDLQHLCMQADIDFMDA